jgi:hypothetical protein
MPLTDDPSLDEVLHNDTLLRSFQDYNVTKMHDPNPVPFIQAVEKFRKAALNQTVSPQQLSEMADKIAKDYIKPEDYVAPKYSGIDDGGGDDFLNVSEKESQQTNARVAKMGQIARGEIPMPSREEMAATFDVADKEIRKSLARKGNNLDNWKQSPAGQQAIAEIQNAENRITQLDKQAAKLQSSKWEQFKAFFKGGTEKEMAKLLAKIDEAKMDLMLKSDPERFHAFQNEKGKMAGKLEAKQAKLQPSERQIEKAKMANFELHMDNDPMSGGSLSKEDRAKLEARVDKVVARQESANRAGQQKEELLKSRTVGESLQGKLGNKAGQGQSGPRIK